MQPWIPTALAILLTLAGCLGTTPEDSTDADDPPAAEPAFEAALYTFDGEFLVGGVDEAQAYTFEVPNGTTEVMGLLAWTMPGGALDFQLFDPGGEQVADGWAESDTHRYVTTTDRPAPGEWTAVVTAQQGVDVHYSLEIEARQGEPFGPIERTYTVQPEDFAEINLNMVPGDAFGFSWESDGELYFNVHYHADGETARPIEHTGNQLTDNFTAPDTEVYSLLWRNEGVVPVDVTVSVDGTYRLHSMTRDAPES